MEEYLPNSIQDHTAVIRWIEFLVIVTQVTLRLLLDPITFFIFINTVGAAQVKIIVANSFFINFVALL